MTDQSDFVKIQLAGIIVHLLEERRYGGRPLDAIAAGSVLGLPAVKKYLGSVDPVHLPLPRDGADNRFKVS